MHRYSRRLVSFGLIAVVSVACDWRNAASPSPPAVGGDARTLAGAQKLPLFNSEPGTCAGGALLTDGPSYGFVVLNATGADEIVVQVSVKGASPNTTYSIWVNQYPGDCPTEPIGSVTTNEQGNGNGHVSEPRVAGATSFWVSVAQAQEPYAPISVLRTVSTELD